MGAVWVSLELVRTYRSWGSTMSVDMNISDYCTGLMVLYLYVTGMRTDQQCASTYGR